MAETPISLSHWAKYETRCQIKDFWTRAESETGRVPAQPGMASCVETGKLAVPKCKDAVSPLRADLSCPAVPAAATLSALEPPLHSRWWRWWEPGIRRTLKRGTRRCGGGIQQESKLRGKLVGSIGKLGLALCVCSQALRLHKE